MDRERTKCRTLNHGVPHGVPRMESFIGRVKYIINMVKHLDEHTFFLFRVVRLHVLSSTTWIRDKTDMTFFNTSLARMTPVLDNPHWLESRHLILWSHGPVKRIIILTAWTIFNVLCTVIVQNNFHVANTLSCLKHTVFVQSCFWCVFSSTCF